MADTAVAAAERTLPHNLEAERSVLGAILVHNEAFNEAVQVIDPQTHVPAQIVAQTACQPPAHADVAVVVDDPAEDVGSGA